MAMLNNQRVFSLKMIPMQNSGRSPFGIDDFFSTIPSRSIFAGQNFRAWKWEAEDAAKEARFRCLWKRWFPVRVETWEIQRKVVYGIIIITWWLIPLSEFCPSYKWINPTYPTYNWDITHFTKWDELASMYEFSF